LYKIETLDNIQLLEYFSHNLCVLKCNIGYSIVHVYLFSLSWWKLINTLKLTVSRVVWELR
jgi:hypothetical protein